MRRLLKTFFWGTLLLLSVAVCAEDKFQPLGKEVSQNPLIQTLLQEGKGKVQVLEFFSYGCHWCYKLDPYMDKWQKQQPNTIAFQRIPVEFQPSWKNLSKAYYTLLNLNKVDTVHPELFAAIQTEKITSSSEEALAEFLATKGVKTKDFTRVFGSDEVNKKEKWSNLISHAYRITAVPAVVVQGPAGIFVTTVAMAGSEEALLTVINDLVKMQRQ